MSNKNEIIAGYGDNTRPYCGSWINYRIKERENKK